MYRNFKHKCYTNNKTVLKEGNYNGVNWIVQFHDKNEAEIVVYEQMNLRAMKVDSN